ncbi:class I SAM-dependent methyltransferase [Clostridium sp.]|uniref:class I SAM-dependent methyltransferase n=1 Tax=Clostridium sp. TaxID=1506 RepID=UPI00258C059D|nr:class I SAM-dependent methyltransferase [Clostridium sp.]MDF2504286.1 putative methyltransferase [Clostridium sp.]
MGIQDKINDYWSERAEEFSRCRLKDLEGLQRKIWKDIIKEMVPSGKGLRALDIGTGGGFYAVILADLGFEVTAIDYSEDMINSAMRNSKKLGYENIKFIRMDAQNLEFQDESFDFIISRNVTWTLPDPKRAYEEWCRVLKSKGKIMNFDANYGQGFKLAETRGETYREMQKWVPSSYNRAMQSEELIRKRNDFATKLYICNFIRPQWDVDILLNQGINKIILDTEISNRVYIDVQCAEGKSKEAINMKKDFGSDSKMFMVCAVK